MVGLYISLGLLGLAAVDPVGIAIMPLLLIQKRPLERALIFLSGSFASLMLFGVLFAKGLGQVVLRFENRNHWFVPTVELLAGVILLMIAAVVYVQYRRGKDSVEPSERTRKWLNLTNFHLFVVGALLVAVQSVLDVVFAVAMVRVGQYRLNDLQLVAGVATYAAMALVIQIIVVVAYRLAPPVQRTKRLKLVNTLLAKYSSQTLIAVSLVLGILLLGSALLS
jgi:hypothetical protein